MSKKGGKVPPKTNPHLKTNVSVTITHSSLDSIPIREDQTNVVIQELNLAVFKTKKCAKKDDVNALLRAA